MFSKSKLGLLVALSVLSSTQEVFGRMRWLERDNGPVFLHPRRFGQENPGVINKLSAACPGQVCGTLAGAAITPLLAAQPECSQQDMADQIIDAAQQFDDATKTNMIALAKEYRQAEKNTPPDFTTNPPANRNSVFCQKAPKNAELNGLVQAQDPANDPELFFDPATKATVKKGSQANTAPFGGAAAGTNNGNSGGAAGNDSATSSSASDASSSSAVATGSLPPCESTITITVSGTAAASATDAITLTSSAAGSTETGAAGAIGNFGKCSVPEIEFATGFDNRKETSFQPVDKTSFNHGSAQAIGIITQFICDTLTNSCGADQTAKDTCQKAITAANAQTAKTGAQADAFNAAFGKQTQFANVAAVDNQGNIVPGTGSSGATSAVASATSSAAVETGNTATASATSEAAGSTETGSAGSGTAVGNFGKCSVPEIEFATGFDNRKETSFQPVDKTSFNHGSAQAIGIITQFICDTLTNSCGADQTAKDTCQKAIAAANAQTAKTGAQADAFNAAFGIQTNFANVQAIDDQGRAVGGTAGNAGNAGGAAATTSEASSAEATSAVATSTSASAEATPTSGANNGSTGNTGGNLQKFTKALGGVTPPAVTALADGQFQVDGNSAFKDQKNALVRSCDVQHNKCANAANASGNKGDLTVTACGDQQTECNALANA